MKTRMVSKSMLPPFCYGCGQSGLVEKSGNLHECGFCGWEYEIVKRNAKENSGVKFTAKNRGA